MGCIIYVAKTRVNCAADLRLCFRIGQKRVSHDEAHLSPKGEKTDNNHLE